MVRRWTRVNKLNENLNIKKKKYFHYFFVTFKRSIIFKKYRIKHTRFIRRALVKAKHKGNWSIYLQIFKNWVLDFKFAKACAKYQLFREIFWFSTVTYDFCHLNLKQFNDYQPRFFFSSHLSKSMQRSLSPFNLSWDFSHAPANISYLPDSASFNFFKVDKPIYFPIYLRIGGLWAVVNLKENFEISKYKFDFNALLQNYSSLSYKQFIEVYKVLALIWVFFLF